MVEGNHPPRRPPHGPAEVLPRTEIADDAVTFDAHEARRVRRRDDGVLDMMVPPLLGSLDLYPGREDFEL